jgi:uncharacterized membrane protein YidH (DUF202 family)
MGIINISGFKELLTDTDTEPTELFLGLISFTMGIWLLNPLVNTFDTTNSWQVISRILSEEMLGLIFIVIGLMQCYYSFNNYYKQRIMVSILTAGIWTLITMAFILYNITSIGIALFTILVIGNLWIFYRLAVYRK